MNGYQSIATISSPEFINLQPLDINPLMSKCEIKVLYLGNNRNGTSINRAAAIEMAKTLRGAPIVGYYKTEKNDFFDHGEQIIYDGDGVHFNTLTKPYGFVSPDANVWFQEFEETLETGETIQRTYLMTTGYLWTGQYQEAQQVLNDGGKPQSMELDKNSMTGFWSKEDNSEMEFFIINDAVFSKLCILGDDVEPCFEGSSITAPNISSNFSLDDNFKRTLYQMMKELQYALQGGSETVGDEQKKKSIDSSVVTEIEEELDQTPAEPETPDATSDTPSTNPDSNEESGETSETAEGQSEESGENSGEDSGDGGEGSTDYEKKEEKEEKEESSDDGEEDEPKEEEKKKEDDKYSLLLVQFEELQASYNTLKEESEQTKAELEKFKNYALEEENKKKDALIQEFYMLSDEDKKDVIEHKAEYSLSEIKSKLAVLCYDKKVSYAKADEDSPEGITVDVVDFSAVPEWLQAVDNYTKNN